MASASFEEVALYRGRVDFLLVAIRSSDEARFERSRRALDKHKDSQLSFEEFVAQSFVENESFVESLVDSADVMVENNGSVRDLEQKIQRLTIDFLRS